MFFVDGLDQWVCVCVFNLPQINQFGTQCLHIQFTLFFVYFSFDYSFIFPQHCLTGLFCLRVFIFSLLASTQIRLKRDFDLPGVKMQLKTFTATAAASLCIAKINRYEFAQCTHFRTCTNALTRYVVAVRVYY